MGPGASFHLLFGRPGPIFGYFRAAPRNLLFGDLRGISKFQAFRALSLHVDIASLEHFRLVAGARLSGLQDLFGSS